MALPDKFQFRTITNRGFTHTAKKNAVGDYEVEWAKGWLKLNNNTDPWIVISEGEAEYFVNSGGWIVVDDAPKAAVKDALPDDFYFQLTDNDDKEVFRAKRSGEDSYIVTWQSSSAGREGMHYGKRQVEDIVARKVWTILDKPSLTPEQQRANKEFQEQIAALEAGIRISEQAEDHQQRMQAQYRERIETLKSKIVKEF